MQKYRSRRQFRHDPRDEPMPQTPFTASMMISGWAYRLVQGCEILVRAIERHCLRPCRLQLRCLFW